MVLRGKKILLGITGSIAAYKSAWLVRLLKKEGAEVRVILSPAAKGFVTPLTLSTLSEQPVYTDFFNKQTGEWNSHVDLGLWADIFLIAPVTAATLSKMAAGHADNLLLTTYLSARCPVFFAPAMDLDMYKHPSTQQNIRILQSYGNTCIQPESGALASGLEGEGRMPEPETILEILKKYFPAGPLTGKKVLVSAGPTYEAIDAVRFIGNHSSGLMGIEIANYFSNQGSDVTLVCGPSHIPMPYGLSLVQVTSAAEMATACLQAFPQTDICVMAAAVADYTPAHPHTQKLKKEKAEMQLPLLPTTDILSEMGKIKKKNQVLVGFALETTNEIENARKKLIQKNADMIVLNSLNDEGAGFSKETNKVYFITRHTKIEETALKSKKEIAAEIGKMIVPLLQAANN